MNKLAITALFIFAIGLLPSLASASTTTYQPIDANQCSISNFGFTASWLGGRAGCPADQTCVMTYSSVGIVPGCMATAAVAPTVNYPYTTECNNACGHTCTLNSDTYAGSYYCAPISTTLQPAQSSPAINPIQTSTTGGGTAGSGTTGVNTPGTQTTGVNTGTNETLINPLKAGTSLESFLTSILQFVIRLGAIVVVIMLVFVGFKFVEAQGNEAKLTKAREMLLWTIIGALVLLGSQAIALSIQATVSALGG